MKRNRYERPGPFGRPQTEKPPRRMLPGRSLNPRIQRELRHANQLLNRGEHGRAAEIFAQIAVNANDLGIIYPAPLLHLQAAQAQLLADQPEASLAQAHRGLDLLGAQERWDLLHSQGQRYLEALAESGLATRGAELAAWLGQQPQATGESASLTCPYCGANASLSPLPTRRGRASQCTYCDSILVLPDA